MKHLCTCGDCEQRWDPGDLVWPIPDVSDRVTPGEVMPAGECPDCGALVHLPPGSGVVERVGVDGSLFSEVS